MKQCYTTQNLTHKFGDLEEHLLRGRKDFRKILKLLNPKCHSNSALKMVWPTHQEHARHHIVPRKQQRLCVIRALASCVDVILENAVHVRARLQAGAGSIPVLVLIYLAQHHLRMSLWVSGKHKNANMNMEHLKNVLISYLCL